jgi:hypothetical protein
VRRSAATGRGPLFWARREELLEADVEGVMVVGGVGSFMDVARREPYDDGAVASES